MTEFSEILKSGKKKSNLDLDLDEYTTQLP